MIRTLSGLLFMIMSFLLIPLKAHENIKFSQPSIGRFQQESSSEKANTLVPHINDLKISPKDAYKAAPSLNASTTILETAKESAKGAWTSFNSAYKSLTLKLAPKPELDGA